MIDLQSILTYVLLIYNQY